MKSRMRGRNHTQKLKVEQIESKALLLQRESERATHTHMRSGNQPARLDALELYWDRHAGAAFSSKGQALEQREGSQIQIV